MAQLDFAERLQDLAPGVFPNGLRPAQEHVLAEFADRYTATSDVGIELPTGEGKTLIGLLIADWALDEGMAVAYLTGTRQLAEQVMDQARSLSELVTHRFAGGHYPGAALDDYHQAHAVGVMNYWVYFNSSPRVEPADLVIFDEPISPSNPWPVSSPSGFPGWPEGDELSTRHSVTWSFNTPQTRTRPSSRSGTAPRPAAARPSLSRSMIGALSAPVPPTRSAARTTSNRTTTPGSCGAPSRQP